MQPTTSLRLLQLSITHTKDIDSSLGVWGVAMAEGSRTHGENWVTKIELRLQFHPRSLQASAGVLGSLAVQSEASLS